MREYLIVSFFLLLSPVMAQHHHNQYADYSDREIKALSSEEVQGYLSGEGMGMALAAELNHYPGPKHVLELKDRLELTPSQLQRTRQLYEQMHTEAMALGEVIVREEYTLDSLFTNQAMTAKILDSLVTRIGNLKGQLRAVHLRTHLRMREALTDRQVEHYHQLRGYGESPAHGTPHQHN